MLFKIGQKIAVADDSPAIATGEIFPHAKGSIHEVTGFGTCLCCINIDNEHQGPFTIYWKSARFRPLTERKTDISQFVKLLDTTKTKLPEET